MSKRNLIIIIAAVILTACNSSNRKADLTGIDFNVEVMRFDSAFWRLDTTDLALAFEKLATDYPNITYDYLTRVVNFGEPNSPVTHETYLHFINDTNVQRLYNDALKEYENIDDIENELTMAFRRAKYYFPNIATPNIYTHVSGFNQSIIVGYDFLSLSIDNYLGNDYEIYKKIGIYEYQRMNMHRDKIVSDYLSAWLTAEFPLYSLDKNLLSDIIYRGKIHYIISQLLPETRKEIIIGYTQEQWEWVTKNEKNMWEMLIGSRDLYATDLITRGRYINDGPFTLPFTQESPSRAGIYLGWQIVDSYMRNNPNISIMQLMQQPNAQIILTESKYRP